MHWQYFLLAANCTLSMPCYLSSSLAVALSCLQTNRLYQTARPIFPILWLVFLTALSVLDRLTNVYFCVWTDGYFWMAEHFYKVQNWMAVFYHAVCVKCVLFTFRLRHLCAKCQSFTAKRNTRSLFFTLTVSSFTYYCVFVCSAVSKWFTEILCYGRWIWILRNNFVFGLT